MGNYEIIVKSKEIKKKMREEDYAAAQRILDTIDRRKVKNTSQLGLMAEVYSRNSRYEEAMELLLKIYHKTNTRKVLFQLIWTSIQLHNIEDAEGYLKEYEEQVPGDYNIYILRYQIDKMKGEGFEVLIRTLESLKETEYIEQWAYELAKLYYKAGMEEECIRECSDIILWFGEGSYVEKAKVLKAYYSGEANKDMIIEELKKRAQYENTGAEQEPAYGTEEEDAIPEQDFEEEDFRVQFPEDIFAGQPGGEEETAISDGEGYVSFRYTGEEEAAEEHSTAYEAVTEPSEASYAEALSERELAEQEVEDELYRLLEEENDEESVVLNRIAEETGIDLYELFGSYLYVKTVRKQLVKSLDMIMDRQTKSVQMIITGTRGSGKTTLAKSIAVFLNMTGKLKSSRIAKISAENLNAADIQTKSDSLRDCCLVIENASELRRPTIDKLLELIRLYHGDIAVIFEENKKNMNKLFRECPKLMDMFKNRIHLPQYTEEELIGFACFYIKTKDYRFRKGAKTALKKVVNDIVVKEAPEQQLDIIRKVVQDAMASADARASRKLTGLAVQGKLKEAELLSLLPEDFKS